MPGQKVNIDPLKRRALFDPSTYNEADNTVEMVIATPSQVRMYDSYIGDYIEILKIDKGSIRMQRMESGAPLLDNHDRHGSTREVVLGSVVSAFIVGGELRALIRLSARDDMKGTRDDIKAGIIRNVSCGYFVYRYEVVEQDGGLPIYTATDWEPYEVSLVPVPADYKSGVRSASATQNEVEIVKKTRNMPTDENTEAGAPGASTTQQAAAPAAPATESSAAASAPAAPAATAPAATDPNQNAQAAAQPAAAAPVADETRASKILLACDKGNLPLSFARSLIDNKTISQERALEMIMDKYVEGGSNASTRAVNGGVSVKADEADKKRSLKIDALSLRAMPELSRGPKALPEDRIRAAQEYVGMSLLDMAKDSLEAAGENTRGMSKMELVGRAITQSTSDFPILLEGTNRRVLLAAYQSTPDTWRQFAAIGQVGDFRDYSRLRMGSFGVLDEVRENQEYKYKSIPDAEREKIRAKTKGNLINVSRQMIINDDLSAFTRLADMLGRAAGRSIESDVYALFALNGGFGPTMGDGAPLFDATHGNIAAIAAAPTVTSFEKAMQQMAVQMDPSKNDYIDIRPDIWLGPLGISGDAKALNENQYDVSVSNKFQVANRVRGLFSTVVGTPRLPGTAWYALANPAEEPVFEVVFLDGVQNPHLEAQQGWNVDGMEWKVRMDYGVGAIGWRGAVLNAGA